MTAVRYGLLGLAHPRAAWFTELGRWAKSAGTVPDVAQRPSSVNQAARGWARPSRA